MKTTKESNMKPEAKITKPEVKTTEIKMVDPEPRSNIPEPRVPIDRAAQSAVNVQEGDSVSRPRTTLDHKPTPEAQRESDELQERYKVDVARSKRNNDIQAKMQKLQEDADEISAKEEEAYQKAKAGRATRK